MTFVPELVPGLPDVTWPAVPARGAAVALALQFELQRTERWAPDRLEAAQLAQTATLLGHARAHSPYWADRLAGVDLDGPWTLARLRDTVGVMSRAAVQEAGEALFSTQVPAPHGRVGRAATSGSSGRPLHLRKTELMLLFWRAMTLREHLWHDRDLRGTLAQIRDAGPDAAPPDGLRSPAWGPSTAVAFATGPSVTLDVHTDVETQARWVVAQRPAYLLCYPSIVAGLLDVWERDGTRPEGLLQVRTFGEQVPEGLPARVRATLGVDLVSTYSCQEVGYLGLQCPHGSLHVPADDVLVEVLHPDGTPCGEGETGEVVVTSLHNAAMPLVRYAVGDMAEVGGPCPCGRTLPTLAAVHGRVRHLLVYPDGCRRWPIFGVARFREHLDVRQWQIVQDRVDHLDVRLVVAGEASPEALRGLVRSLQAHLDHPFAIDITRVDGIPRGPTGKYEDFRSEVATSQLGA